MAPLVHHELCFGCGRTNLFGLLLEAEETSPDSVAGRAFVKQDHQGGAPGQAHEGIVVAALIEAMAFASGASTRLARLEVEFRSSAPVGAFLEIEARVEKREQNRIHLSATARAESDQVAFARGRVTPWPST